MLKKLASIAIIAALVFTLGGTAAFANDNPNPSTKTDSPHVPSEAPATKDAKPAGPNEQLKNNMLSLVAEAKAGKVALPAKSQIQPAKSNHWSKKTKIIVGVGAVVTVVVVILVVQHARHHFFDDFRLGNF